MIEINCNNLKRLLEFSKHFDKWIQISSRAVYQEIGNYKRISPIHINEIKKPIDNPYSILKYSEEKILISTLNKVIIFRLFDTYSDNLYTKSPLFRWLNLYKSKRLYFNEEISPIYINDVGKIIRESILNNISSGFYNLCGNEVVSIEDVIYHLYNIKCNYKKRNCYTGIPFLPKNIRLQSIYSMLLPQTISKVSIRPSE